MPRNAEPIGYWHIKTDPSRQQEQIMNDNNNLNRDAEGPGNADADHCGEPLALSVDVLPFGPDQARIDQAVSALLAHPLVRELTIPGEYRLLNFGLVQSAASPSCSSPKFRRRYSPGMVNSRTRGCANKALTA